MTAPLVLIAGASDLGTACALRLFRSGIKIILLEKNNPIDLYHLRSFSAAIFSGKKTIEEITATTFSYFLTEISENTKVSLDKFISYQIDNRQIPILNHDQIIQTSKVHPDFIVDTTMDLKKTNPGLFESDAKMIGFTGSDSIGEYDYLICKSGLRASRVMYPFLDTEFEMETDLQASVKKFEIIRAPIEGVFEAEKEINATVNKKDVLGNIAGIPILSPVHGCVSGVLNSGIILPAHEPFIEIDTEKPFVDGKIISSDAFGLAGGVLEALFHHWNLNNTAGE